MIKKMVAALLLAGVAGCNSHPSTTGATSSAGEASTATNLDNVNLSDTAEDATYASSGEALAKENAALIGTPAPAAVLKTIDGQTIDLARSYGKKPIYIKFWATWCVPCRQQMPGFEKAYQQLGDKMDVVAINIGLSDDEASVRKFREKYGLTMPIVMDNDGHLAKLFHLDVTPQHVLIGKDVRFAYFGHADNATLQAAIQRVIAGPAGAAPATAAAVATDSAINVGDVVPALAAVTTTGARFPLGGARPGRLRAVEFLSSWCEWYLAKSRPLTAQACARRRRDIETIKGQFADVDWIGIAGGPWATDSDLANYRKNNKVTIPLALDKSGALFRAFGIRDIPTVALIDADGRLVRLVKPDEKDLAGAIRSVQPKRAARGTI